MKKLLLIVPLLLSGCGLSVIQKQKLADNLNQVKASVDSTCASAPTVEAAIQALIDAYTK